jgi:SpoVK/Ycf46/Vps4 family AAA+-type ATPase
MPVYYLPLGDPEQDKDLISLVQQIRSQCMLLIEDVDVYHAATDRDDDGKKASLSAVLNTLDGIWTPHGLVTVLTTNDRDALDPALLRAGRVDLDEEFTVLDLEQAQRLAVYAESDLPVDDYIGRSPADYLEAVRREASRPKGQRAAHSDEEIAAAVRERSVAKNGSGKFGRSSNPLSARPLRVTM